MNILLTRMKNKKLKNVLSVTILFLGIYYLSRIIFSQREPEFETEYYIRSSDPQVLAGHYLLPSNFRGKKLPFHRVYETRQVGFPKDLNKYSFFTKTKVILLWTPWNGIEKTINYYFLQHGNKSFVKYNCPNPKCVVTSDRKNLKTADAVLFHLLDTKSSDLPQYRTSQQAWILYNMEPPWQIKKRIYPELSHLKNVFNWTMSYRRDSDVTASYGFIMPSNKQINFPPFHNKTKNIVWFVSDCVTDSRREDYVRELNKYIEVDVYGQCGHRRCYPSQSSVCYEKILNKYKFYLSFENAICKDYVTEKFFNIYNYDIIPIVFGATKYSSITPVGTFIDATLYSEPEKLARILLEIGNNEDLYRKMLLKKHSFTAYLDPWMCRLCDKLHTSNKSSTLDDVEEWWLNEAQCKTWNKINQVFEDTK